MQPEDANVLFSGALLGLNEAGGAIQTHNKTPSHLGIERPRVSRLVDSQNSLAGGKVEQQPQGMKKKRNNNKTQDAAK
jgi:hypothetical protein